jgi:hypothetical protein
MAPAQTLSQSCHSRAVMANVIGSNPVRDVSPIQSKTRPKGAPALRGDELRGLLAKLRGAEVCQRHDLVDPITLFIATGGDSRRPRDAQSRLSQNVFQYSTTGSPAGDVTGR